MNTTKKAVALVHKTWLAGVGVYDNRCEKTISQFDQIFVDGSAFVNDLLEKGELVEAQIQAKLEARKMFKDKISALSALKAKLGFGNESRDQQIDVLSQRVDSLIEVVAKLAQQKSSEKKATTASSTVKKTPAKTTAKPAAKATVTKKSSTKPVAKVTATKTATKPATAKVASKPKVDDKG